MATAKKTTAKKSPAKKTAGKKSSPRKSSAKTVEMKSFKVYPETVPFNTFKITKQTVYWVILIAFIVFSQLWILKMQMEVSSLIETQQATINKEI